MLWAIGIKKPACDHTKLRTALGECGVPVAHRSGTHRALDGWRVEAVRQHLGDDMPIMVDACNSEGHAAQAVQFDARSSPVKC